MTGYERLSVREATVATVMALTFGIFAGWMAGIAFALATDGRPALAGWAAVAAIGGMLAALVFLVPRWEGEV